MRRYMEVLLAGLCFAFFILMLEVVVINSVLNCQTWDKSQWTEESSCFLFGLEQ